MGTVIYEISTSLDGFTTAADPTMEEPMGVGGQQLFAWASGPDEAGKRLLLASGQRTGASIAGRRTYDTSIADWKADWPGGDLRTPTFIVSHTIPDDVPEGGVYTFVSSPLEAVEAARQVAGDRSVDVFSSSIGNELLRPGPWTRSVCMSPRCCSGPGQPCSRACRDTSSSSSSVWNRPRRRPICDTASSHSPAERQGSLAETRTLRHDRTMRSGHMVIG